MVKTRRLNLISMLDWKKIGKKLLFPSPWIVAILSIICAVALVKIFMNGWEMTILAYVSYILSFYTFSVICIGCWKVFPVYYKTIKFKLHENKYIDRYMIKNSIGDNRIEEFNDSESGTVRSRINDGVF